MIESILASPWSLPAAAAVALLAASAMALTSVAKSITGENAAGLWVMTLALAVLAIIAGCLGLIF